MERFNRFSCERCWSDASHMFSSSKSMAYRELVDSRDCTPEQQAGRDAEFCEKCQRWTIHQIVGACLTCPVYCYPMPATL